MATVLVCVSTSPRLKPLLALPSLGVRSLSVEKMANSLLTASILKSRKFDGLAARDLLATLAAEKEAAMKTAKECGLSTRAFSVFWMLCDDTAPKKARVSPMNLAKEAEALFAQVPNAVVSADEQRRLRAGLYRPCSRSRRTIALASSMWSSRRFLPNSK